MELHAVGPGVDVAAVGVRVHQAVRGAQVAASVVLVETRRGEAEQIHFVARGHVLHHRRRIDFPWSQRLGRLHLAGGEPQQFQLRQVGGQPQGKLVFLAFYFETDIKRT